MQEEINMTTSVTDNKASRSQIKNLLGQFLFILLVSIIFAQIFHDKWTRNLNLYHTILELTCVFIAMTIFIGVWFSFNRTTTDNYVLGFGYLAIGIFDAFHTFYFLKLNVAAETYFDLSTRYWILGRLTEGVVLYISVKLTKQKVGRVASLLIVLASTFGISYFMVAYHDYLPVLLNEQGVTPLKVALEHLIIFIYFITLWKAKDKIRGNSTTTYSYIILCLLLSISSEFCFTMYSSVSSISWTVGHVLRILAYYYLLKGVFAGTVTYPYERLEVENKKVTTLSDTLNDILDTLPMAVFKYNLNGEVEYLNKRFEELFGCRREDLVGLTNLELVEKFPRVEMEERPLSDIASESDGSVINSIRTYKVTNGEFKKLSINTWKLRNGVFSIMREAREEQELNNLHIQTETILNAVGNSVMMIDTNNKVVLCNDALAEVYEMDKNQIIGVDIDQLNELTGFTINDLESLDLEVYSDDQPIEVSLTTPKGNKKDLVISISSINNVYGEKIGTIVVGNDVTELKKQHEKLMQQEKLALMGQMGAAIVHETRNYLTTIKGRCQLINLLDCSEEVQKYALKINSEVDEVNKIISEFLFLSKPRQTELTEVSMIDIFQSVKSMVETTSLVKGVNVNVKLSKDERYLLCDEGQLKQVILNICKNAVDAMSHKKDGKLQIETGFNEISNEMFIRITDNGKGISKDDLNKIGTPFFTTKSSGTGLGLSVCYNIIKQHKGRIEVESEQDVGTTFTIIVPCIADDEDLEEVI
jgi:PAS domain S-box-containing protein